MDLRKSIELAEQETFRRYGKRVSVDAMPNTPANRPGILQSYGRTIDADASTLTSVERHGAGERYETYVSTNAIDTVSSNNASDTAVTFTLEGYTVSNGDFTFVKQTVDLNGQNKVTLSTPLARVTKAYALDANAMVGELYVYEDTAITAGVPNDATKVHLRTFSAASVAEKSSEVTASDEFAFITGAKFSLAQGGTNDAEFMLQTRQGANAFYNITSPFALRDTCESVVEVKFDPPIIVPNNSDIRVSVSSSANNTTATCFLNGLRAIIR